MKALVCGGCMDIRALPREGSVTCRCGNVTAWWTNPAAGTAKVYATDRSVARILGMHNGFLQTAFELPNGPHEDWRKLHEVVTDAPNHVFDQSRRACWATLIRVGYTSDVSWADERPADADSTD